MQFVVEVIFLHDAHLQGWGKNRDQAYVRSNVKSWRDGSSLALVGDLHLQPSITPVTEYLHMVDILQAKHSYTQIFLRGWS